MTQQMVEVWCVFEACLQEGAEFVRTETPIKAQGLQKSISVYIYIYIWETHSKFFSPIFQHFFFVK